jgi:hypothetical protein
MSQRDCLKPAAAVLSSHVKDQLRHYFSHIDLDRVRVVHSDPLPIPDPPFYSQLLRLGLDFPRPAMTSAITLDYLIASRAPMSLSLLFHELVHVVQFRLLGVKLFSRLYLRGFLSGGSYYGIPLERCAFELGRRFETDRKPFDVNLEVGNWIKQGLF